MAKTQKTQQLSYYSNEHFPDPPRPASEYRTQSYRIIPFSEELSAIPFFGLYEPGWSYVRLIYNVGGPVTSKHSSPGYGGVQTWRDLFSP